MAEELLPFTSSYMSSLVTVLSDEDLHKSGLLSEDTLDSKYHAMRDQADKARPPLDPSIKHAG
jgi:hypothetical protein